MKALSMKQPWAYLVVQGCKDIENRTWPLPKTFKYPQRIYVHAGKRADRGFAVLAERMVKAGKFPDDVVKTFWALWREEPGYDKWFGAIVGEVDIIGELTLRSELSLLGDASPWFVGPYGFLLANPVAYPKPVPYKGVLGFFAVPDGPAEELNEWKR